LQARARGELAPPPYATIAPAPSETGLARVAKTRHTAQLATRQARQTYHSCRGEGEAAHSLYCDALLPSARANGDAEM